MATYMVKVEEVVVYHVPVEYDGEWDEDAICTAAEQQVIDNVDRDKWSTSVFDRWSEYIGTEDA